MYHSREIDKVICGYNKIEWRASKQNKGRQGKPKTTSTACSLVCVCVCAGVEVVIGLSHTTCSKLHTSLLLDYSPIFPHVGFHHVRQQGFTVRFEKLVTITTEPELYCNISKLHAKADCPLHTCKHPMQRGDTDGLGDQWHIQWIACQPNLRPLLWRKMKVKKESRHNGYKRRRYSVYNEYM